MRWAHIMYKVDGIRANVPFSFIKNYESTEILAGKQYHIFWSKNPNETPESIKKKEGKVIHVDKIKKTAVKTFYPGWYLATVYLTADSEDDLIQEMEKKRVKLDGPSVSNKVEDNSPNSNVDKKHYLNEAKTFNLNTLKAKINAEVMLSDDSQEESFMSTQDIPRLKKSIQDLELTNNNLKQNFDLEIQDLKRKNEHLKEKLEKKKRRNEYLKEELEKEKKKNLKLSEINLKFQERYFTLATSSSDALNSAETCTYISASQKNQDISKAEEKENLDLEWTALVEKYISLSTYKKILKSCKRGEIGDGIFIKNLSAVLWSPEELAERSATGLACPTKKGELARKECTPEKKEFMKMLFEKRIEEENGSNKDEDEKRKKKMNKYLSSKITTVRRDMRNKERFDKL